jgi:hypothetical protein
MIFEHEQLTKVVLLKRILKTTEDLPLIVRSFPITISQIIIPPVSFLFVWFQLALQGNCRKATKRIENSSSNCNEHVIYSFRQNVVGKLSVRGSLTGPLGIPVW